MELFGPDEEWAEASELPQPTQASLDLLWRDARGVRVCEWDDLQGDRLELRRVAEVVEPVELTALHEHLQIVERNEHFHCMCVGSVILQVLSPGGIAATLAVHHGRSVRWDEAWGSDALLRHDGYALAQWLADRGARSLLDEMDDARRHQQEHDIAFTRWCEAMPSCLAEFHASFSGFVVEPDREVERWLVACRAAYSDEASLVGALLRWHGVLNSGWFNPYLWERWPEELLKAFPNRAIVDALRRPDISDAHLEGAARYFVMSPTQQHRDLSAELPADLRRLLIDHVNRSDDAEKITAAARALLPHL